MKALFKVETKVMDFCVVTQNLRQSPTKTLGWEDLKESRSVTILRP